MSADDKAARLLDLVEAVWWEDGDTGLTLPRIKTKAPRFGLTPSNVSYYVYGAHCPEPHGSTDALWDATTDRVVGWLHPYLRDQPSIGEYTAAMAGRPAAFQMMRTGYGIKGAFSDDLREARTWLGDIVGVWADVERLHGLIDGLIAGRLNPALIEQAA